MELPPDITNIERKIISAAHAMIYAKLKNSTDKFIVAYVFDLGYSKEEAALALGCSYKTVWERIKKIKEILREEYNDVIKSE